MLTKMNVLLHVVFLTIAYSTSPVLGSPGPSGCHYFGNIPKACGQKEVAVETIPCGCSSLFFDGLSVDNDNNVALGDPDDQKYISNLLTLNKPLYVFLSHASAQSWADETCDSTKCQTEAANLQNYLCQNPGISGIVLTNLSSGPLPTDFATNLVTLITAIRDTSKGIEVGAVINASFIVDNTPWLDVETVMANLDFAIIDFIDFNPCTDKYLKGTVPLDGEGHTIQSVLDNLSAYGISDDHKCKLLFRYSGQPIAPNAGMFDCEVTYSEFCSQKGKDVCKWCADTEAGYNAKGKVVKDNGLEGFLITFVDVCDNTNECNCGQNYQQFPAFQFTMDGYNGVTECPKCPKFDGPDRS